MTHIRTLLITLAISLGLFSFSEGTFKYFDEMSTDEQIAYLEGRKEVCRIEIIGLDKLERDIKESEEK
jgi:hypothetical protein